MPLSLAMDDGEFDGDGRGGGGGGGGRSSRRSMAVEGGAFNSGCSLRR